MTESNLQRLRRIVESSQNEELFFFLDVPERTISRMKGGKSGRWHRIDVDLTTAAMLLACYDALVAPSKEKFEQMLEKPVGFSRLVDWGWKQVSLKPDFQM